ncbi:peptidoglycan DD-metalloendopeptidase family protein [Paenibacillus algorifonticola]|uniref:peptidoglycan DD-metalloendopeptidase family protein n=1 Tax=Paenibacillus algorifonticola TaxID=684063 RepID=UPI003D2971F3
MKKPSFKRIKRAGTSVKIAAAVGTLAVILTACGGEDTAATSNSGATNSAAAANQAESAASIPPAATESAANPSEAPVTPEQLPEALLAGNYKGIYERFSAPFKESVSEADFIKMAESFMSGVKSLEKSSILNKSGAEKRTWVSDSGTKGIVGIFDAEGTIIGLQVKELSPATETDSILTKNSYSLPFHGEWLVIWGGNNALVNYHYEYESQRYAYDFVQAKDGYSYEGDPLKNESYFAFGQDILAPADGTVVSVVNDIADNEPVGVMNEKVPAGNMVVIDHGGEYSYLAHMKKGSAVVKPGDKVSKGDVLGQTGNSGNSSEAHLHFQLSDGKDLFTSSAIAVKWEGGMKPVQGETIGSAE